MRRVDYSISSNDYDKIRATGRKALYDNMREKDCLLSLMPKDKTNEILDVGCGTGKGVLFLVEEEYKVIGLDFTMNMLKLCRNKINDNHKVKLIQGDAGELPFPNNSIKNIISLNFLHLFSNEDQKYFINEMARVVKPQGVVICQFNNYYRGLIAGRQTLKINPTLHLNRKSDFKFLFSNPKLKIEKIHGTAFPYMWRLFQYMPNIGVFFDILAHFWPFYLIAPSFMVRARKL